LLDALAAVVLAAAILASFYWDQQVPKVVLPLAGAALIIYFWVSRWRAQ
jgi:hypothetical protein